MQRGLLLLYRLYSIGNTVDHIEFHSLPRRRCVYETRRHALACVDADFPG